MGPEDAKQSGLYDFDATDSQAPGLLSIEPEDYLGRPLGDYTRESLREYGLDPSEGPLTRHSYLYSAGYVIGKPGGRDKYAMGKIELRGRVWTYSDSLPPALANVVEQTAHRAGECFNTTVASPSYGGYLDGFNPIDMGSEWTEPTTSWEGEVVGGAADVDAQAGRVDWNVEVYDGSGRLSGVAQGIAAPWSTATETVTEQPPREEFRILYQEARDEYEIRAAPGPGGSTSNQQRRAENVLPGKTVYVNDKPIGTWRKARGSAALKKEYVRSPKINGRTVYDRERLVEETEATYQALSGTSANPGKLYKVEETEKAVYLVTARRRPDVWEPVGPNEIDPYAASRTTVRNRLVLRDASDASALSCRRDEQVIRLLGLSSPPWSARVSRGWRA